MSYKTILAFLQSPSDEDREQDKADAEEFVGSTIGQDAAQERVMEVFDFMSTISTPTEPAYTAAASVAVTRGDLKRAVALLREMARRGGDSFEFLL